MSMKTRRVIALWLQKVHSYPPVVVITLKLFSSGGGYRYGGRPGTRCDGRCQHPLLFFGLALDWVHTRVAAAFLGLKQQLYLEGKVLYDLVGGYVAVSIHICPRRGGGGLFESWGIAVPAINIYIRERKPRLYVWAPRVFPRQLFWPAVVTVRLTPFGGRSLPATLNSLTTAAACLRAVGSTARNNSKLQ